MLRACCVRARSTLNANVLTDVLFVEFAALLCAWLSIQLAASAGPFATSISAAMFLLIVTKALHRSAPPDSGGRTKARELPLVLSLGLLCFILPFLCAVLLARQSSEKVLYAFQFYLPAAAEELVFRKQLPAALRRRMSPVTSGLGRYAAGVQLMSAATFAAAHYVFIRSPLDIDAAQNFVRLVAFGLLMSIVAAHSCISAAIGLHAALNAQSLLSSQPVVPRLSLPVVATVLIVCLTLIAFYAVEKGPSHRECDAEAQDPCTLEKR